MEQGNLSCINTFSVTADNDTLYYILYACKQIGMNQESDTLFLCGNKAQCTSLKEVLDEYLVQVSYRPVVSDTYSLPNDAEAMPIEMLALTQCVL